MKATFYAQFEKRGSGDKARATLVKATMSQPDRPSAVVVKVSLNIPDAAFEPLEAEGDIEAGFVGIPVEVAPQEIKDYIQKELEKSRRLEE